MYPAVPNPPANEVLHEDQRGFTGDGSRFLYLPRGVKEVTAVRVGDTPLPEDLFQLATAPDGSPALLRAETSHDGTWQRGQRVIVTGVWK